jgi:hypothetical protein
MHSRAPAVVEYPTFSATCAGCHDARGKSTRRAASDSVAAVRGRGSSHGGGVQRDAKVRDRCTDCYCALCLAHGTLSIALLTSCVLLLHFSIRALAHSRLERAREPDSSAGASFIVRVRLPHKGQTMQRRFQGSDPLTLLCDWVIANDAGDPVRDVVTTTLGKLLCRLDGEAASGGDGTLAGAGVTNSCSLMVTKG